MNLFKRRHYVDIVIPVYNGFDDTKKCIESLLASANQTPTRIIVINDKSPDERITKYLRGMRDKFILLENEENLGFVKSVNIGMKMSRTNDILLLNSDTVVPNGFLDRLRRAAYLHKNIATVTPFSNNATIASYPAFLQDNEMPMALSDLDALFEKCNKERIIEIPTGVGFCMYIRRKAIRKIGLFDEEAFGKGYGEENDFCMRSSAAGWKNVLACDTFVFHKGNVSFSDSHTEKKLAAMKILRELYPTYEKIIQEYIQKDPPANARGAVDLARIVQSRKPTILLFSHARGGGTQKYIDDLIEMFEDRVNFLLLDPCKNHESVYLRWKNKDECMRMYFHMPTDYLRLENILRGIKIHRIHVHHHIELSRTVLSLLKNLDTKWDFTAHDYFQMCPQVTMCMMDHGYCGEEGPDQCCRCLNERPLYPIPISIEEWRDANRWIVEGADRVFCPSHAAYERYKRYFPNANYIVCPHPEKHSFEASNNPFPIKGRKMRIAVLGGLSYNKGLSIFCDTIEDAYRRGLPFEFRLFGIPCANVRGFGMFSCSGEYNNDDELISMLDEWKPDIAWFPARCPETYSYTLSAAMACGIPVAATDIGAIAERATCSEDILSWTLPWIARAPEWNDLFVEIMNGSARVSPRRHVEYAKFDYSKDYLIIGPPVQRGEISADIIFPAFPIKTHKRNIVKKIAGRVYRKIAR